jgi:glycosyltransferase involved in cell wall biosynthesis
LLSNIRKMNKPNVSVITVVYNAASLLEVTIASIREQTWGDIEYIVIDGGSTDGTVDIIRSNEDLISYWISEADKGLYDAMNKGLKAATGEYVWFINAGDKIYTPETTEKIFEKEGKLADVYYGDTMIVNEDYEEIGLRRLRPPEKLTWKSFKKGMLVCHQSILIKRELADPYDLKYPHSADFDWVIKALKKTDEIKNTHLILSAFLDGGQSKQTIKPSLKERFQSMSQHYGFLSSALRHIPIALRFIFYVIRNKRF